MSYKAKIVIFVLAIILLLPLVATVVLNQTDIKHSIESYIQSKTGRVFTIEGGLIAKWSLYPKIYAKQVKFANSPFARTPYAFSVDKLTVSLSVVALLRGELEITAIELDKPQLWIEWLSETKKYNLDLRKSGKISKRRRLLPDWIAIKKFIIRNGEVVYFHKNRDWEFIVDQATVESMDNNLPTRIEGVGEIEKTVVSMSGELGNLESLLRFQESPITLNGYVGVPSNQVSIVGVIQNVFRWYGLNLWVDAQVSNLVDLSDLFGFWLPPYRNISAKLELVQPKTARTMRLESLQLHSSDHGLQAYAEGEVGRLVGFNDVNIRFTADGNLDKEIVSSHFEHGMAEEVALDTTIVGRIVGDRKNLTLELDQAEIQTADIHLKAVGTVPNVFQDWSAPLPLNVEITNLDSLLKTFNIPEFGLMPDTQTIHVMANLQRHKPRFALHDITISSASDIMSVEVRGEINTLGSIPVDGKSDSATPNINLSIDMNLDVIDPLRNRYPAFPFYDVLAQLFPLQGTAQLSGSAGGYALNGINIVTLSNQFSGRVHGDIVDLFSVRPEQARSGTLSVQLAGVAGNELMADIAALKPFVLSGDLSGSMDIRLSGNEIGLDNIDFNINSAQTRLNASGAFSQLSPLQFDHFALKFDAQSLSSIIQDTSLPLIWDNEVRGTLNFNNNTINNIMLDMELGGNDFAGEIGFVDATDATPKRYKADLHSKNFDLTTVLAEADDDKSDKAFPDTPLKLDWLMGLHGGIEADVVFRVDHFKSASLMLDEVVLTASTDKGEFRADLIGTSSQGAMNANLALTEHAQTQKLNARLRIYGKNVDLSALTKLKKSASDKAGILSVDIDIDGVGNSIAEMAGNAAGSLLLEISGATVKNDGLQFIAGDLFLSVIEVINPLSRQAPYLDIECGVIRFDVNQGIATTPQGLVLKTADFTFIGGGDVNLSNESLKLNITSKARTGFGINVNSIVKVLRVGGTIKNPNIQVDPAGLIQSAIALGTAIVSGGVSLIVQGVYDKNRANADVCRSAVNSGGGV